MLGGRKKGQDNVGYRFGKKKDMRWVTGKKGGLKMKRYRATGLE